MCPKMAIWFSLGLTWGWSAYSFTLSPLPFFLTAVASGFLQLLWCSQSWPSKADSQQLCSAITQLSLPRIPSAPLHFCTLRCLKRALLWSSSSTHRSPIHWILTLGAGTLKISSQWRPRQERPWVTQPFSRTLSLNHLPQQVHVSIYILTLQKLLWLPLNFIAHFNTSWVLIFPRSFLCAQKMLLYSFLCSLSLLPLLHTDFMHT